MLAPWRSPLSRALHRNRALVYSRYFQLATVTAVGRPANRTVVFRGFRDGTNELQVISDRRSQKIAQLQHQNWAEVCWYFPKTREQFRLAGHLNVIGAELTNPHLQQVRQRVWQRLSEKAQAQFFWPPPGETQQLSPEAFTTPAAGQEPELPKTYCLLLLDPDFVDHLELRGEPQNRYQYERIESNSWQVLAINP